MMAIFNHFDFLAPYYDRFIKPTDPSQFIEQLELPVPGLMLDLGGGTGRKSQALLKLVKGLIIADSSMGMLSQASKKGGFITICTQGEWLPFSDASFERVIMVDALHHVIDYRMTAGEIWRVIKPGGRIIIEEPDIRSTPVKIMAVIEKIALMRSHFVSPPGIAACFNFPNALINIKIEKHTAWIIINKQG